MNVEWRKAVWRTAGLPRQTRSVLLPGLTGNENFHTQYERRVDNRFHTILSSCNPAVSFIATKALHHTVGTLGRNRTFLSVKNQDESGRLILHFLSPLQHALGSGDEPRVEQICELIRTRGGSGVIEKWAGMGLINYDGIDCEFFCLVLCINCANLHVPCYNWFRINTRYIFSSYFLFCSGTELYYGNSYKHPHGCAWLIDVLNKHDEIRRQGTEMFRVSVNSYLFNSDGRDLDLISKCSVVWFADWAAAEEDNPRKRNKLRHYIILTLTSMGYVRIGFSRHLFKHGCVLNTEHGRHDAFAVKILRMMPIKYVKITVFTRNVLDTTTENDCDNPIQRFT